MWHGGVCGIIVHVSHQPLLTALHLAGWLPALFNVAFSAWHNSKQTTSAHSTITCICWWCCIWSACTCRPKLNWSQSRTLDKRVLLIMLLHVQAQAGWLPTLFHVVWPQRGSQGDVPNRGRELQVGRILHYPCTINSNTVLHGRRN
jgi:hypothetical protein